MREAGILLPIFSLPSRYGIGCFSKEAYRFVDFLAESGQRLWQILPMGVTGVGDSPYQSFSAFAGNPYFIDLEALCREGLLTAEECESAALESEDGGVDYEKQYLHRLPLLRLAFDRTGVQKSEEQRRFEREAAWWLADYALFMAIKKSLGGLPVSEWREDLRRRDSEAMEESRRALRAEIEFHQFLQFHFWKQWRALKEYANAKGIRIVGDLPIYVSADSADVWVHPDLFLLDAQGAPIAVAGCPPDGFSPNGQLWGNPLYRWEAHREEGFSWWISRLRYAFSLYDTVRIDHFRGFDSYYAVPFGAKDARNGRWERGPSMVLFDAVERALGKRDIIAEDLGYVTESVRRLVEDSGFAGMKILQFGWEESEGDETTNEHLPHRYEAHCAAYTGTHDNPTLSEWISMLSQEKKREIWRYLGAPCDSDEALRERLLTCLLHSRADRCIVPIQDYLGVGGEGRINRPATTGRNWRWRLRGNELCEGLAQRIAALAEASGRK